MNLVHCGKLLLRGYSTRTGTSCLFSRPRLSSVLSVKTTTRSSVPAASISPSKRTSSPLFTKTRSKRQQLRAMASTAVASESTKPIEKFRKDYTPAPYTVDNISLNFILNEDSTLVESTLTMKPQTTTTNGDKPDLFLDGRSDITLISIKIDGTDLSKDHYKISPQGLTILSAAIPGGKGYTLTTVTSIKPQENSSLEGLYKSGGNFCTQCEAEGFRGITYFLDRPDVMATYTTRIEADKTAYPVLLGNGNLIDSGDLDGGRHYTIWKDPFRKPCYLFALVAGNLSMHEDHYTTLSGKKVTLRIFVQAQNIHKVSFAMESLIRSMKWDEDVFGLEYDLELFNIVAVDDFNMGAMENKSLNVFNSRLVLATPDTATDGDFARIEGVVGHEYFHNWTGNRVTCRDWFQLTLKEGLTVYRDQEFSADMNSRPVKRVEDVVRLRGSQFTEDSGPMAHPVRPESYIKMDNFYTLTVYEKGAEVVRLYEAVLGKEGFRKGMDLYFKRHDGQAVTCDDFLAAMADANGEDLSSLAVWYGQAGTPVVEAEGVHDPAAKTYTLKLKQQTPPSPGQPEKHPVLIPVRISLLAQPDGAPLPLLLRSASKDGSGSTTATDMGTETVLRFTESSQDFVFEGVVDRPVPSMLRGFSAPVNMSILGQTDEDLVFLLAHDTDAFNRWEAGQVLAKKLMLGLYNTAAAAGNSEDEASLHASLTSAGGVSLSLVDAFKAVLADTTVDGMYKAFAISLPADSELIGTIQGADPTLLHKVRHYVTKELALRLRPELEAAVAANDDPAGTPYEFNAAACARRALKNKSLGYLATLGEGSITSDLQRRFRDASNMTDEMSALLALDLAGGVARAEAIESFYNKWKHEPLVLLKWLSLQSESNVPKNVESIRALMEHPAFNISNPNNCYSLFLGFTRSPVNFHAADGSGYEFMGDAVLKVDSINRQVAARMVNAFTTWKRFDGKRQEMMKRQLQRIVETEGLSENVFEIANKSLQ